MMSQSPYNAPEAKVGFQWKPKTWLAVILTAIAFPLGFFYAGRIWTGITYFILAVIVGLLELLKVRIFGPESWVIKVPFIWPFIVIAATHTFLLAKTSDLKDKPLYATPAGLVGVMATILLPVILIRSFVLEPFSIPSRSMEPTVKVGNMVFVYKWPYGNYGAYGIDYNVGEDNSSKLARGDLIVFYKPRSTTPFLGRIVGLQGETVKYKNKNIFINGNIVKETFVTKRSDNHRGPIAGSYKIYEEILGESKHKIKRFESAGNYGEGEWTVPKGHFFMMGDNRDNSNDSRYWNFLPQENIIGKVIYIW